MNWLLSLIFCALLVEAALRLPFAAAIKGVIEASGKALRTVRAKAVSDHWKEKAMGAYARKSFLSSLTLAALLVLLLAVAGLLIMALNLAHDGFQDFALGWQGLAASAVIATLYFLARRRLLGARL